MTTPETETKPTPYRIECFVALFDRSVLVSIVIVLLIGLWFAPWWALGRMLAPLDILNEMVEPWADGDTQIDVHNHFTVDAITQFLVYRKFAERSFEQDGLIGWSSLIAGGSPIYAQTTAAFNDWTMQLHRFFDYWTAWHLGYIGQFVIAALGMFVFLRSQRLSPIVGLMGATAFVLNSQFVLLYHWRFQLGAFSWVPWLLWALYRYRDGKNCAWPLIPIFMAFAFVGGTLQTNGYLALLMLGVWSAWLIDLKPWRLMLACALTSHFALWGLLGIALAAFALVPNVASFLDNLAAGNVRGVPGYGERPPYYSVLLMPTQVFPTLLGSPRSIDLTKLFHLDLFAIAYFGFVPAIIAFRCVFAQEIPRGAQILLLLGLLAPLTPLVASLYHRLQIVYVIGGIWAFAWYWQHAKYESVDHILKWVFYLFSFLAGLWLIASIASLIVEDQLVALGQKKLAARMEEGVGAFRAYKDWMLGRPSSLIAELRIWHPRQLIPVLTALACFGALWLRVRVGILCGALVMVGALLIELGAFAWGWMTFSDPEKYPFYEETADIAAVRKSVGDGRVFLIPAPDRPKLLPPNILSVFEVATIQQYENIRPPTMWDSLNHAEDSRSLGLVGVTHAIGYPDQHPQGQGWELEYQGDRLNLWRNKHALPRYLAIANGQGNWLDQFNANPAVGLSSARSAGDVRVIAATQNRRSLFVPKGTAAIRVAENWSEGWYFRVENGPLQPVLKGADTSMIIPLGGLNPPSQVTLHYEPRWRRVGFWLTVTSIAATLIVWPVARWRPTNRDGRQWGREINRSAVVGRQGSR
jgi:hypothetical protein